MNIQPTFFRTCIRVAALAAAVVLAGACTTTTESVRASDVPTKRTRGVSTTSSQTPPTVQTKYGLARLLVARGDLDGAAIVLESITNEHKEFLPAYTDLAVILAKRGRLDLAEEVLNKGLRVEKSDPLLCNDLGVIKVLQEDYRAALTQFEQAATLAPGDPRFRANQALSLALLGDYSASLAMYQDVVSEADALHNVNLIRDMVEGRHSSGDSHPSEDLQSLMGMAPEPLQPDAEPQTTYEMTNVANETSVIAVDSAPASANAVTVDAPATPDGRETSEQDASQGIPETPIIESQMLSEPETATPPPETSQIQAETPAAAAPGPQLIADAATVPDPVPEAASTPIAMETEPIVTPKTIHITYDTERSTDPPEPSSPQSHEPNIVDAEDAPSVLGYTVQVASFDYSVPGDAYLYKDSVEESGEYEVMLSVSKDRKSIRATIGTYSDYDAAHEAQRTLATHEQFKDCFVRNLNE